MIKRLMRLSPLFLCASLLTYLTISSFTHKAQKTSQDAIKIYKYEDCEQVGFDWIRRACQKTIYSHFKNECYLLEKSLKDADECVKQIPNGPQSFEKGIADQVLMTAFLLGLIFFYMKLILVLKKLYIKEEAPLFRLLDRLGDFLSKFSGK
ncbi:MAG: hypothetical protein K9K67_12095 [Bacteriovoracaceae bacterium]|nr:hypothetical protein [Bacteriovoracaceae bacterium]